MRWLVYGGFAFFVLMPAIVQGLQWNLSLAQWNREFAAVMGFPVFEEYGDSGTGVVLLVFQWTFFTSIYVFLLGLFGGVRLLFVSVRFFRTRLVFLLAFVIWLGLVCGRLWWGGFLDDFREFLE